MNHWFWLLLTIACVVWYSTITVYVSIKGARDIKNMLARLDAIKKQEAEKT
jgi:1-phosphofructokinase family hexose kinase